MNKVVDGHISNANSVAYSQAMELDNSLSALDCCEKKIEILWSDITRIKTLTSDIVGVVDPSGVNSYSKVSKLMSHSNFFFCGIKIDIFRTSLEML